VNEVAELIAKLTENNKVEFHFIPSHTEEITQNEEIDELAKYAAELAEDEIDHDPFTSSYKVMLKKWQKMKLIKYLTNQIKASQFKGYPNRDPLITGKINQGEGGITILNCDNALLNRVRSGHTRARVHLKNINIETENTCRHCERHR
jgi:hypothetical protein